MIITRIPPSPTGALHIGTARTALFNFLYSRRNQGQVLFRSEDTDKARSKREYEEGILKGLKQLGLSWDNEDKIIRQSERTEIYREYLEQAIKADKAYLSKEESKSNPGTFIEVVRLRNPNTKITFNDLIRGDITFDTTELGDIVIARSLDDALYHFVVVVDDHLMGVTHVLRGEDHISNTPRQILIQEALNFPRPIYAHLPLILAPDRTKMSKRHGATSVSIYIEMGFLPEAMINYLALLGWNPGNDQEIMSLEEITEKFTIEKLNKSGAIFDLNKFLWINREHLKKLTNEEFITYLELEKDSDLDVYRQHENFLRLLPLLRERVNTRTEAHERMRAGEYDFAINRPNNYDRELLKWKNDEEVEASLPRLQKLHELLLEADFSTIDSIKTKIFPYAEEIGKGEVLWPLRVALSGQKQSPDPFTLAYIVGQTETLARIKFACAKID